MDIRDEKQMPEKPNAQSETPKQLLIRYGYVIGVCILTWIAGETIINSDLVVAIGFSLIIASLWFLSDRQRLKETRQWQEYFTAFGESVAKFKFVSNDDHNKEVTALESNIELLNIQIQDMTVQVAELNSQIVYIMEKYTLLQEDKAQLAIEYKKLKDREEFNKKLKEME